MAVYPRVTISLLRDNVAQITLLTSPAGNNMSNVANLRTDMSVGSGFSGFQLSPSRTKITTPLNGAYLMWSAKHSYPGSTTAEHFNPSADAFPQYTFSVHGNISRYLYITFDTVTGEYATKIILSTDYNAQTLTVNNTASSLTVDITSLGLPSTVNGTVFTMIIAGWSKPNATVKVTSVSFSPATIFYGNDLIGFECSDNLYDSSMNLQPGICEQYADVTVYDRHGILRDAALKTSYKPSGSVTLEAIDTETGMVTVLGEYGLKKWDIQSTSAEISITCGDKSTILDSINLPDSTVETRTVDQMLQTVFVQAGGLTWSYLSAADQTHCNNITVPNSWFYSGTLREVLEKICNVGLLRIYWKQSAFLVARCFTSIAV